MYMYAFALHLCLWRTCQQWQWGSKVKQAADSQAAAADRAH
jgi:hypothetical protein